VRSLPALADVSAIWPQRSSVRGDVRGAVGGEIGPVYGDDVGVPAQLGGDLALTQESLVGRVLRVFDQEDLDRHPSVETFLMGAVDNSGRAAADLTEVAAAGNYSTGRWRRLSRLGVGDYGNFRWRAARLGPVVYRGRRWARRRREVDGRFSPQRGGKLARHPLARVAGHAGALGHVYGRDPDSVDANPVVFGNGPGNLCARPGVLALMPMPFRSLMAALLAAPLTFIVLAAHPAAAAPVAPPSCANPVGTWSTAERLEQLIMVSGQFADLSASAPEAQAGVGAFVLFGQPAAGSGPSISSGLAALVGDAESSGRVLPWMSTDEEGGTVARLANVIGALPTAREMAAEWAPGQVESAMYQHGQAMRSLGVTVDLAPVVDVASPSDTVADENDRSFSDDPQTVTAYGDAYAAGLEAAGVVPVVKHFPGLGHANANTDDGPATDPSLSQLEADDLIPFGQAIGAGIPVVMVGHPTVPGLTDGLPASLAPATYTFLRNDEHFSGVALTDSLGAGAISDAGYSEPSAAVTALEAGADMVMIDATDWSQTMSALEQALSGGSLSLAAVDNSVERILTAKAVPTCPSVGLASTPGGYWTTGSGGGVTASNVGYYGSLDGLHLTQPVVSMTAAPGDTGYWLVSAGGGVFSFGAAAFHGSMGGKPPGSTIVGMAVDPATGGYWLVAAGGGVFSFDAPFFGSMGGRSLGSPIVGMAASPDGGGYWLVAAGGGVFAFGDAAFHGSMGGQALGSPLVGLAADATTGGYWLAAAGGGIFSFDAPFHGAARGMIGGYAVTGISAVPDGDAYRVVDAAGAVVTLGSVSSATTQIATSTLTWP
jgi:beta-N-acetylhexosaminidase